MCAKHGGSVKAIKAAGERRYAVEQVRQAVDAFNVPLQHSDPAATLQREIDRTAGNVEALNAILAGRGIEKDLLRVTEETKSGGLDAGTLRRVEAAIGPYVDLYLKERDLLLRLTRTALQVGLEQWRIHLQQRQLDLVEGAMLAMLQELGHDAHEDPAGRAAMATGLRWIATAARTQAIGKPESLLKPPLKGR
ncbi:hypothetical protein [Allobranchiibius sp. GilTou73]|uniref:hypothetical protein n=1 Tax=Allobranchiibius sp. GilTou73 TaxID=2904523 RepID=UPI001F3A62C3|nr:hypothetical protein [Allobranchiibius sp. GilTou73]UIJ33366.1 hypothetical protein LVQ62_09195 [Allobranchiibius sp. GilTou73]